MAIGKESQNLSAIIDSSSVGFEKENTEMSVSKKSQRVRAVVRQLRNQASSRDGESNDEAEMEAASAIAGTAPPERKNEREERPYEDLLEDADNSSVERSATLQKANSSRDSMASKTETKVQLAPNETKKQMRRQQQ